MQESERHGAEITDEEFPQGRMMMMGLSWLLVLLVLVVAQPASAAVLLGQTVETHAEALPAVGTYAGPIASVVGAGVEIPGGYVNNINIDYSDTQIRIFSPIAGSPFSGGFTFNGLVFDDKNLTIPAFTSVTIDPSSTLPGFGPAQLSFTADEIRVNLNGLGFRDNNQDQLVLNVNARAVGIPEPATLLLLAWGFAALVWRVAESRTSH